MSEPKRAAVVWRPQPRQLEFMRRPEPEALYGGAAGGGKSDALVIEALRQVHIPHYRALILRKTYPQLTDLVDKSQLYYRRAFPGAQYNATSHVWVFPSGAKIYFGSLQYTKDRTNYQGKAFDFIGFDELTHFEWEEYSYLMSRNRPTGPGTRVYLRATTNPGGVGHGWVKARFITPAPPGTPIVEEYPVRMPDGTEKKLKRARVFIPSSVFDNPALLENDPDYLAALASLPEADAIRWGNDVVLRGLNVRELETALKKERNAAKKAAERKANAKEDPWGDKELREMQLALQEELGRRVTINRKGVGGILTIAYSDEDDLIDLVDKLLDGD